MYSVCPSTTFASFGRRVEITSPLCVCVVKIIPSFTIHLLGFCELSLALFTPWVMLDPYDCRAFYNSSETSMFLIVCRACVRRWSVEAFQTPVWIIFVRGSGRICIVFAEFVNSHTYKTSTHAHFDVYLRAAKGIAGAAIGVLLKGTCVLWGRPRFLFSLLIRPAKSQ